jgi:hypothetical protein
MLLSTSLLLLQTALAQDTSPPAAPAAERDVDLLMGVVGVGEVFSDAAIASVYRSSAFTGSVSASWQFHRFLAADVELTYFRTLGEAGQRFEMTPIALNASAWKSLGNVELFGGLGPAIVPFTDQGTDMRSGTKLGLDARVGMRVGTSLYNPPDYPPSVIERVDLEIFLGRRSHFGPTTTTIDPDEPGEGVGRLDLSAARVGIGLKVRL